MSNHNGNANKLVSDTPRTDAEMVEMTTGDGPVKTRTKWVHSSVCIQLERELNAANDRIKLLEDCVETAWGVIANVDDGSWQEQRSDWREAAIRWRDDQFHPAFGLTKLKAK